LQFLLFITVSVISVVVSKLSVRDACFRALT